MNEENPAKNTQARELLLKIARCPLIQKSLDNNISCSKVASYGIQKCGILHLPEPWNGDIVNAPILFLSSNPSIDCNEYYPEPSWEDERIVDFFVHRFDKYIKDGKYPMLKNGTFRRKRTNFWSAVISTASYLLQKDKEYILPGKHFAITEVVHCKTEKEIGVLEAIDTCVELYLKDILTLSGAKVVVVLGKKAQNALANIILLTPEPDGEHVFIALNKTFVFLPHPNARGKRRIDKVIAYEELTKLQNILSEHN